MNRSRPCRMLLTTVLLLVLVIAACAPEEDVGADPDGSGFPEDMGIADQPGMAYAPLVIIKEEGWLDEEMPDTEVRWERIASPPAVREAMISGEIDVGAGSANGSFLVGWSAGVEWGLLSGMSEMDIWLMVSPESGIESFEDFGTGDQIAVPSPDSLQANILRLAAEEHLGDANALDDNMVAMGHPDALAALLADQVEAHFSSPPFQFEQEEQGATRILGAVDVLGPHTFTAVYVNNEFADAYPDAVLVLNDLIARAIELIEDDPATAAQLLSDDAGGDPTPETFERYMGAEGIVYTQDMRGMQQFAEFLADIGQIERAPEDESELLLEVAR